MEMLNPTENDESLEADRVPHPHMRLSLPPVVAGALARGHDTPYDMIGELTGISSLIGQKADIAFLIGSPVGMERQALDVLGVGGVVALGLLLGVVENHHAGHKVDHLP